MQCPTCKVVMKEIWDEPLGLMCECPCCFKVIELHYERRKTPREDQKKCA